MKAVIVKSFGKIDQLLISEVVKPQKKKGEVLIKVVNFSLNPVDYKTRQGGGIASRMVEPIILGWDISGTIEEVGSNSKFQVGDRVFGMISFPGQGNAYAEYVCALESDLAIIPKNINFSEAAGATLAALTAYQTLIKYAKIQKGNRVLIHAGAGGVGHIAIQMAKQVGAIVISTASKKNEGFLKELGVDEFIDYTKEAFEELVNNIDVVLDCVGGEVAIKSLQVLRSGGIMISIPSPFNKDLNLLRSDVDTPWILVQSNGNDMKAIAEMMEDEKLIIHVEKVYRMDEIQTAHLKLESRHTRGKLVVEV